MPKFALACYESVPENRLVGSCSEMLDVVLGIRNQHLFDELGRTCQKYASVTHAEARERAIFTRRFEQKVEQAGAELAQVATGQRALRSRRQSRADRRGFGVHIRVYQSSHGARGALRIRSSSRAFSVAKRQANFMKWALVMPADGSSAFGD